MIWPVASWMGVLENKRLSFVIIKNVEFILQQVVNNLILPPTVSTEELRIETSYLSS